MESERSFNARKKFTMYSTMGMMGAIMSKMDAVPDTTGNSTRRMTVQKSTMTKKQIKARKRSKVARKSRQVNYSN